MNRGIKALGIIFSLLLLSVLLMMAIITSPYLEFPFGMRRVIFLRDILSNMYIKQFLFWTAIVFSIALLIVILVLIFYPRIKKTFVIKEDNGRLSLDKKAIEGFVHSKLKEVGFVSEPKVKVRATKNKLKVYVTGQLTRTSSIIGKTGALMEEIEDELQEILGTKEKVKVDITYKEYENKNRQTTNHSRVD
ncbi:alkaline shock response membrane anchor protein AmaP [Enterococcus dongliensis]|uniref:alkaline shock response membrane anchor protein AmaP n=1 Tax=Enterococcus dongliensis TaxID=2559925 RepID=UPI00288F9FE6|nr:alkaline shock response membrane anchor protein AmaP [Enterococcus dongliensis]MDT2675310.1 alkaline shock response membrane anchor protein AmaP [Enterococcus dongliensis]